MQDFNGYNPNSSENIRFKPQIKICGKITLSFIVVRKNEQFKS